MGLCNRSIFVAHSVIDPRMRRKHTYIFLLPSLLAGSFTQGFAQSVSDSLAQDHRIEDVASQVLRRPAH